MKHKSRPVKISGDVARLVRAKKIPDPLLYIGRVERTNGNGNTNGNGTTARRRPRRPRRIPSGD